MIDFATWRKAWELLDGRERRAALIVFALVIVAALSTAAMVGSVMPFLTILADPGRIETTPVFAWAYDAFGFTSAYSFIAGLGVGSICVIIAASLVQIAKAYVVARFTMMRTHTISYRLLSTYLRQPYEFFLNKHSGDMGTRVLSEAQQVVSQFFSPAAELLASALTVIAVVTLLIWLNPVVAFICFAVLGGIYGGVYAASRRALGNLGGERLAANSERYRMAAEAFGGVKDIKILGREISYLDRYETPSRRMAQINISVRLLATLPQLAIQAVGFGGVILLCLALLDPEGLASGKALGGILPLLGVFVFAGQRLMPELGKVYECLTTLQYGSAAVLAVCNDFSGKQGMGALPRKIPAGLGLRYELRLKGVSYHYPNAERAGIRDLSLMIRAGEKIGVVGSTGAGKTTLVDLILGLLRPTKGKLIVDGVPIENENARAWQQSVGYVPQSIFLTDASVRENIALGVPPEEIDQVRVECAAKIAQLDGFIRTELSDGYDTLVGERGVRLSGGQRQRIGIARAFYHNAELIVFDEATSALDNLTERELIAAISSYPEDKTMIVIAHRLSTVRKCDRIAVLDQGRLVGLGTWDQLMTECASFRRIAAFDEVA